MQSWAYPVCVVVLAGGLGILENGCGGSISAAHEEAGTPPDVPISSGGAGGGQGSGSAATAGATTTRTGGGGSAILVGSPGIGGTAPMGGSSAATDGSGSSGGASGGASGCIDVCALHGEACCLWTDPCLMPSSSCTFDVLASSVGVTYEYTDLETKVAALPQDISASFTDQDIAWAAADPWPAGRIELHLTDDAASRYGKVLDGAQDCRVFRVSCGGQSLFVGVFYLYFGAAALDTPVLHEARENGVLVLRIGAYQSAWFGRGLTEPGSTPYKERIDRPELRAALCRRGVMHVLDPNARPSNP